MLAAVITGRREVDHTVNRERRDGMCTLGLGKNGSINPDLVQTHTLWDEMTRKSFRSEHPTLSYSINTNVDVPSPSLTTIASYKYNANTPFSLATATVAAFGDALLQVLECLPNTTDEEDKAANRFTEGLIIGCRLEIQVKVGSILRSAAAVLLAQMPPK
ncbi:hypothetical protein GYMLUDRAFT_245939 [Collybiopsis luxurians FD-317 M1]|uniref:Uncharacterized protein n=1 Tax=Collybiopsis luxurians FD-317 M1 TaxID=944289 RepID=A0A0D0C7U5_9AGAR|nr:hypothetical protein GYMLUDRAFT_245939 [Collybiopsis luxurians FD-317 M1]